MSSTITFANGTVVPTLGFGLYLCPPADCKSLVLDALKSGYSASFYGNEPSVGEGLAAAFEEGVCTREEVFVTSKVWNDAQIAGNDSVRDSVLSTLRDLRLEYLDLFLVHWPVPGGVHCDTYKVLEEFVKSGKIKALGVSNYNREEYEELVGSGLVVPVQCNQVDISPLIFREEEVRYFEGQGVRMVAYKPLQRGGALNDETVKGMAEKYGVTEAKVLIKWGVQKGFAVLTKTSKVERMRENLDVWGFTLEPADVKVLDNLTTKEAVAEREKHELKRKTNLT